MSRQGPNRFKEMLTHIPPKYDWRERLREILVDAGTTGMQQGQIVRFFKGRVDADDLALELNAMLATEKVQKFSVPTKGRPAIVWRATTNILKD